MTKNQLIVVSGGTKGIGKAIVEKFAAEGYKIAVSARSADDLANLKSDILTKFNTDCHVFQADLSIKTQVEDFAQFVLKLQIPIRAIINNAGVFIPGKILDEPENTLETMINTNLYSAYYLTRALVPSMLNLPSAHIFNMCSIASVVAYPQSGSYSISKFAMLGFSKSIREELKNSNIKVTALLPGPTLTDSWAGVDIPENRFMTAKDISDIVWGTFCLSPQAVVEEIVLRPIKGDF
jgi:short-subunit dehydrogenase